MEVVKQISGFVSEQINDLRLRKDRSNLMRGIQEELPMAERTLSEIIYYYLRVYFLWDNFIRKEGSAEN